MSQQFSKKEIAFFKHIRGERSQLKKVFLGIIFLLFIGLLIDALSGFSILKNSRSLYGGLLGIFLISLFYLFAEAGASWINSKDKTTHPLYKRGFYLLLLLLFIGAVVTLASFVFGYLNL